MVDTRSSDRHNSVPKTPKPYVIDDGCEYLEVPAVERYATNPAYRRDLDLLRVCRANRHVPVDMRELDKSVDHDEHVPEVVTGLVTSL